MLVLDLVERRQLVRKRAFSEERVGGHGGFLSLGRAGRRRARRLGFFFGWIGRGRGLGLGGGGRGYNDASEQEGGSTSGEGGPGEKRRGRRSELLHNNERRSSPASPREGSDESEGFTKAFGAPCASAYWRASVSSEMMAGAEPGPLWNKAC